MKRLYCLVVILFCIFSAAALSDSGSVIAQDNGSTSETETAADETGTSVENESKKEAELEGTESKEAAKVEAVVDENTLTFSGIVILVGENAIELKKGDAEMTLSITAETAISFKGTDATAQALQVCQKVTARYRLVDGSAVAVKLEIEKSSYCAR